MNYSELKKGDRVKFTLYNGSTLEGVIKHTRQQTPYTSEFYFNVSVTKDDDKGVIEFVLPQNRILELVK